MTDARHDLFEDVIAKLRFEPLSRQEQHAQLERIAEEERILLLWALEQLEHSCYADIGRTLEDCYSTDGMEDPETCAKFMRAVELSGYRSHETRQKDAP